MLRRSHWYLLLLLGTLVGIASCSAQPQDPAASGPAKHVDATISLMAVETGDIMQTIGVTDNADRSKPEIWFRDIPRIPEGYENGMQFAAGKLYVPYATGENIGDITKDTWTETLWRFSPESGSGVKLLEGQQLLSSISNDGRFVAAADTKGITVLRDEQPMLRKDRDAIIGTKYKDQPANIVYLQPASVNNLSSWFYLYNGAGPTPTELIRVDNAGGAVEHFPLDKTTVQYMNDVDPATGNIVYWDRSFAFDAETAAEQDTMPSMLRLYDPATKKNKLLKELPAGVRLSGIFWEDSNTVVYHDNGGRKRFTVE